MRLKKNLPFTGIAAIYLLTAADVGCPNCVALVCKLSNPDTLTISGPALEMTAVQASLVLYSPTASCELTLDPEGLDAGASWSITTFYDPSTCGEDLSNARLWVDEGSGELVERGVCE